MASYSVLALLAVVATCTASPPLGSRTGGAASPCGGRGDGPVSNPYDCGSFYNCENGWGVVQHCPSGQEFNPENGACDYPVNVPQGVCQKAAPRAGDVLCPQEYGVHFIATQQFCNAFFVCGNGLLQSTCLFCPEGQYFPVNGHGCQKISNGDCGARVFIEPRNQTLTQLDPACQPGKGDPYRLLNDKIRRGQHSYPNPNAQYPQPRGGYGQGSQANVNANGASQQYGSFGVNVAGPTSAEEEYYVSQQVPVNRGGYH